VCFTLRFTQIWNHHPDNLALRGSFVRGHGLRINLKRDPAARVPQQFLNRLDILSVRLQQRPESVPESVPADSSVNAVRAGSPESWKQQTEIYGSTAFLGSSISVTQNSLRL
jgi:hypothetical protein